VFFVAAMSSASYSPPDGVITHVKSSVLHLAEDELDQEPDQLPMPESIYGAGMAYLVQITLTSNPRVHMMNFVVMLSVVANILCQAYVLYCVKMYICRPSVMAIRGQYQEFEDSAFDDGVFKVSLFEDMAEDEKVSLCQFPLSQPEFFMVILVMWTAYAAIDITETVELCLNWLSIKTCTGRHALTNLDAAETEEAGSEGSIVLQGASKTLKAVALILILLPKLMIAIVLWWIGARWLTSTTSFEDLIMNAVALAFITDLDEIVFEALVPKDAKRSVEKHSIEVPPSGDRNTRLTRNLYVYLFKAFCIITIPCVYMRVQRVLPGYKFDVAGACEAWAKDGDP
jgi:hypothetical protein